MCGITGIIDPTLSREPGELLLKKMLESIQHRGPDNSSDLWAAFWESAVSFGYSYPIGDDGANEKRKEWL